MLKTAIFALWLVVSALAVAGTTGEGGHILEFGDANIEAALSAAKYSLIYFYMENCRYCGAFEPTYDYLSVLYNSNGPSRENFQVIKTDGKKNDRLSGLFSVGRFPTLKLLNFETKQIVTYDQKLRDLQSIIEFVENHVPGAVPDYDSFQSLVHYYEDGDDIEPESVLVFVAASLHEWTQYKFPGHFIQEISREIPSSGPKIVLVDVDKLPSYDLLARFLVSNFPSLVYVGDGVKTYRTLPQHHVTDDQLDAREIRQFLAGLASDEFGTRYETEAELRKRVQKMDKTYDSHKTPAGKGFLRLQNAAVAAEASVDEEYQMLLQHIEL